MNRLSRLACFWVVTWFASSAFAAPTIFWASDPVKPGETVLVVGDGFGDKPAVRVERLDDGAGGPTAGVAVEPVQASDQSLKFRLPDDLGAGVYRVQIGAGKDAATWTLNKPAVYWAQGDQGTSATPGGWVRVFGRNIGDPAVPAVLTLVADGGAVQRITSTAATPWEARFAIPASLRPGQYTLRISNGRGGEAALADAGRLRVAPAEAWSERQVNVRDFGAVGDGRTDDTAAVQKALDTAGQGGGVVYFPRGRYQLTDAVTIPRGVRLRGERRDWVSVFWPDMDAPPEALLRGSNHFGLENLTLYASNYRHLVVGDLEPTAAGEPGHVRIEKVTIRAVRYRGHLKPEQIDQRYRESLKLESGDTLRLGGDDIVITDSDIYGSGRALYLKQPRGAYIARNHFYNGRGGWYCLSGVDGVIFEDNAITGADLAATGGGINTLGGLPYSQNVYFARNTLSLMHGWDREAMTSDGPGGYYYGGAQAAGAQALTLAGTPADRAGPPERWRGAGIFVLSGRGMGQFAQVRDVQGSTVHMDRPWRVAPDAGSVLTIAPMQQNYLFIDNNFTDAGVALQYYGTSVNHIAAGNKSTRTGGFLNIGTWYHHYQPTWYCQFLGNDIVEGNMYRGGPNNAMLSGEAVIGTFGWQKPPNTAPLALASILRGNHLQSNAHLEANGGNDAAAPGVRDVVVENNVVENADLGLAVSAGVTGLWAGGNRYSNVSEPERGPGRN
ncbi:MAG TPA: glycosyl hydrolase family 28-related protein [Candidatus Acidoferrales bacterium]|nr:glycosyl hydrolase family 28-related protein [Candidatus Acidoferrales bacterium]